MKKYLFIVVLYLVGCQDSKKQVENFPNGIWIPAKLPKDGDFSIVYIRDTSYASVLTQNFVLTDSIYLMTEPGFILEKGKIDILSSNEFEISHRTIYKTIRLFGESLPSSLKKSECILLSDTLKINQIEYIQSRRITDESIKKIINASQNVSF